jgi:phosphoglycolate phosphatase-like HAD superfamily hydrolase
MALDITRVRGLCFDVDGTLRDTDDLYVERLAGYLRLIRPLLPNRDPVIVARRVIMAVEDPGNLALDLADRLGIDNLAARLLRTIERPRPRRFKQSVMIPGAKEMLESLHLRYPMAIISARGGLATLEFLESHALTGLFQVIVTGQTCKRAKPHPMPVLWAAERLGVPAETCLMIGDTKVDIRAGRAAGAQTIGVLCGFGAEEELIKAGAHLLLKSTADLGDALQQDNPEL